jgi:uncharacterized protein
MSDSIIQNLVVTIIRDEFFARSIPLDRILMFGSRATGTSTNNSDWDFLVVTTNLLERLQRNEISNAIISRCAKDLIDVELVINDRDSFLRLNTVPGMVSYTALQKGIAV